MQMAKMSVEAEKLDKYKADSTGRINLGSEFAGKRVEVVVTDVLDDDDGADDFEGMVEHIADEMSFPGVKDQYREEMERAIRERMAELKAAESDN